MRVPTQTEVNREITKVFLKENSFDIVLTRHMRIRTNTGGWTTEPVDLPSQPFAIIGPTAGLRRAPEVAGDVGQVTSYNLSVVGYHDADIEDNDTFIVEGGQYRVDFVFPDREYEKRAVIIYLGPVESAVEVND